MIEDDATDALRYAVMGFKPGGGNDRGVLTREKLWLSMHRMMCGPRCPLTLDTVNAERPVYECAVDTTARPTPPGIGR